MLVDDINLTVRICDYGRGKYVKTTAEFFQVRGKISLYENLYLRNFVIGILHIFILIVMQFCSSHSCL